MDKLLTIIIPSCNMEKYLPKCLGSLVVAQEMMDRLEVLVVNDGSKDRTSEIAHEFAAKWPGTFKVIDKTNGHYGSCINAGLKTAMGAFVKVLDADDHFDTAALETHLRNLTALDGEGVDVVFTDYVLVHEDGHAGLRMACGLPEDRTFDLATVVARGTHQVMHSLTYRTENLRLNGYRQTEGMPYTDNEWALLPMRYMGKMAYRPLPLYQYLIGRAGQSVSIEQSVKNIGNLEIILRHVVGAARRYADQPSFVDYACLFGRHNAKLIYEIALFALPKRQGFEKVAEWERTLKDEFPGCFAALEMNSRPICRGVTFRYVKCWRRHSFTKGLIVSFFRTLNGMLLFYRKMRDRK